MVDFSLRSLIAAGNKHVCRERIVSCKKPRHGCFLGKPSTFLPDAPVYVDGVSRGFVLGTNKLDSDYYVIAMVGDDLEIYFAYYHPSYVGNLSWKLHPGYNIPWIDAILFSHGLGFYGDSHGNNKVVVDKNRKPPIT